MGGAGWGGWNGGVNYELFKNYLGNTVKNKYTEYDQNQRVGRLIAEGN